MKSQEQKAEFIRLRAEGKSYDYIAKKLHIAKGTCCKWEREFAAEIDELKRAALTELYESYGMTKEARIKKLGDTLEKINETLEQTDFSKVDPAKLLDFKLKYTEALKGEYVARKIVIDPESLEARDIIEALVDLLNRAKTGDITTDQANRESTIIANLLKAYDFKCNKSSYDISETNSGITIKIAKGELKGNNDTESNEKSKAKPEESNKRKGRKASQKKEQQ